MTSANTDTDTNTIAIAIADAIAEVEGGVDIDRISGEIAEDIADADDFSVALVAAIEGEGCVLSPLTCAAEAWGELRELAFRACLANVGPEEVDIGAIIPKWWVLRRFDGGGWECVEVPAPDANGDEIVEEHARECAREEVSQGLREKDLSDDWDIWSADADDLKRVLGRAVTDSEWRRWRSAFAEAVANADAKG